jgi:hypothetical protein
VLYPTGTPVAVVASAQPDGTYTSSVCSYLSVADLERVGGTPASPAPLTPTVTPSPLPAASSSSGLPVWAVAVLGLLGGVALIGVSLLAGRRRSGPASEPDAEAAEPTDDRDDEPSEGPVR